MDDESVIAANEHFYQAFRSGAFAEMETIWSPREEVSVYHPNWPGILGREDVMASWYQVMVLSEPPPVFPKDVTIVRAGKVAMVFCTEDMGEARMTASNVFVEEDGAWRMTSHHSAPLPIGVSQEKTRGDRED